MNFSDKLIKEIERKDSRLSVGLDPVYEKIPESIRSEFTSDEEGRANAVFEFCKQVINATTEHAVCFKPNSAFFEQYGWRGFKTLEFVCKHASKKAVVILDAKRGDIGNTSEAYAKACFSLADAVTINPLLGSDSIAPFIEYCKKDKGVFILAKTSNPSSTEFQDENWLKKVSAKIVEWGIESVGENSYSNVGAVVGATAPTEAEKLRKLMPKSFFLVPGFGAQGGSAQAVANCFNKDGLGAVVNSSREIIYAGDWTKKAEETKEKINSILKK